MSSIKKVACMLGLLMVFIAFAATSSMAATCANARISLIGPNLAYAGGTAVQLNCVSGGSNWVAGTTSIPMQIHADASDQVLAVALTAISLGKNVYVWAVSGSANGVITGMYIQN